MAEDMMNEEMTGMAAPAPEAIMPADEPMADEEQSKFDMETLMGNFMDMDDEKRKKATIFLASPAASYFDEIVGEPVMARLVEQLGSTIQGEAEPAPEGEGMMAPEEEPMAEMPMEEEEATPPV
jgi:hypothetical protein